jgi:hypothetical protein
MTVIALTGWDRERSREADCDGHLVKPVVLADLHRLLAGLPGYRTPAPDPRRNTLRPVCDAIRFWTARATVRRFGAASDRRPVAASGH